MLEPIWEEIDRPSTHLNECSTKIEFIGRPNMMMMCTMTRRIVHGGVNGPYK
jgi:hypothetical protein